MGITVQNLMSRPDAFLSSLVAGQVVKGPAMQPGPAFRDLTELTTALSDLGTLSSTVLVHNNMWVP